MPFRTLDKIFNEYYVKAAMLIMSIIYCIPFLMDATDTLINLILVYSALYVIYDLLSRRSILKTRHVIFAVLYLLSFAVTIVIHRFEMLDIKVAVYMFMQLMLFTCCSVQKSSDEIKKEMHQLFRIVIFIGFLYEIISLFLYFISYLDIYVTNVMDMPLIIGKHPNSSLYGIMGNSNWFAFFMLTCIGLSLIELNTWNKRRKYYAAVIIMSMVCLFLTNSRGGLIGLSVFSALYVLYCVYTNKNGNKKKYLLVPLVAITLFPLSNIVSTTCNAVSNVVTDTVFSDSSTKSKKAGRELKEKESSNSIRLSLLKTGIKVIEDAPVFGVGNANAGKEMYANRVDKAAIDSKVLAANSHNIYLQIAVVSGLLGLLLWAAYVLSNSWFMFVKIVKRKIPGELEKTVAIIGCLLLSYMVINLVEADIFISRNFMSTLFWILTGYGVCLTQRGSDICTK